LLPPHIGRTALLPPFLGHFAHQLRDNHDQMLADFLELQVRGAAHAELTLAALKSSVLEREAPHPEVLDAGLGVLGSADLTPALVQIHQPVLVVSGQYDRVTSRKQRSTCINTPERGRRRHSSCCARPAVSCDCLGLGLRHAARRRAPAVVAGVFSPGVRGCRALASGGCQRRPGHQQSYAAVV